MGRSLVALLLVGGALSLVGACALLADLPEYTERTEETLPRRMFDDSGTPLIGFDATVVENPDGEPPIVTPPDMPYVSAWEVSAFAACSDTLCGGTQCRQVLPLTFSATPPDAPKPFACQQCTPPCCNCPDLGPRWFYDNDQGRAACAAACPDGCIQKNRAAIIEQQNKGCVLRTVTCQKGFGGNCF